MLFRKHCVPCSTLGALGTPTIFLCREDVNTIYRGLDGKVWAASLVGEERVVLVNRPLMAVEGDTDIIRNVLFGDISQAWYVPKDLTCTLRG